MTIFGPPNIERLRRKGRVKALVRATNFRDAKIRVAAVGALGEMSGDPRAIEALASAVRQKDREV